MKKIKFLAAFLITLVTLKAQDKTFEKIAKFNSLAASYDSIPRISLSPYKSVQLRPDQDPTFALGLAISGGGSRAQYFSTGVMIGLDEMKKGSSTILKEVDYISSVSGGGFSAGNYLYLLHNGLLKNQSLGNFWFKDPYHNNYISNIKIKTKPKYLITKFTRKRLIYFNKLTESIFKRSLYLPDSVLDFYKNGEKKPRQRIVSEFLSLEEVMIKNSSKLPVRYPFLVPNGAVFTNADLFPFMPHVIEELGITGQTRPKTSLLSKKKRKLFIRNFIVNDTLRFPYNIAISTSAAFPGILPFSNFTTTLNPKGAIKVLDGGLTDNLGMETLAMLLKEEKSIETSRKKAILIYCQGQDFNSPIYPKKRVRLPEFLEKTALYPVEINISNHIKLKDSYFRDTDGIIENEILSMLDIKNNTSKKEIESDTLISNLKNNLQDKETKLIWADLYTKLESSLVSQFPNEFAKTVFKEKVITTLISSLNTSKFADFTTSQKFMLYELASQVETKLKIEPWEREVLILAGRYVAYLNKDKLNQMLK